MQSESLELSQTAADEKSAELRVSTATVLAYGPPTFGLAGLFFFVQLYFLNYATDVLLLAPATMGSATSGLLPCSARRSRLAGQGLIVFLVGVVLQLARFEPNADQTATANLAIRSLLAGIPFVTFLVGAILFRRFGLNAAEHARIQAALAQRGRTENRTVRRRALFLPTLIAP